MKKVTSSWENLNDLLGINEKNVRSTFIYIIAIFSILISWLLLSDYLFLNYLDKLQDGRMIHMLMNLIFMILLGIISVNLIRNFIKSMNKAKEVNSLLSSVADSANEIVIFAINRDYQFTYFNKMAKQAMLELWNKDIMILTSLLDTIVLKEDREKAQKNFEKVFCGETIKLVEDYGHPELKRYYWQNYYAPVYDVKHDIIGASIFSINITNLVEAEKQSRLLSNIDELTGLYNRRYFNRTMTKLASDQDNLTLSIIMADVNGLKFTNDIFGHAEGDQLIKHFTTVLQECLDDKAIIARLGGDEFAILLPNTDSYNVNQTIIELQKHINAVLSERLILSVSFGHATKFSLKQPIDQILARADSLMYHNKLQDRLYFESELSKSFYDYFYQNPVELEHAENTSKYCVDIGYALNMTPDDINILRLAGFIHDIGKITFNHQSLIRLLPNNDKDNEMIIKHSDAGYKILNFFDRFRDIADYVHYHHEHVDGTGFPSGLVDEDIPVFAKIIAVANTYDSLTASNIFNIALSKEDAIKQLVDQKNTILDPFIVDTFINILNDLN